MKHHVLIGWLLSFGAVQAGELLPGGFVAPGRNLPAPKLSGGTRFRGAVEYKLIAAPGQRVRLDVHAIGVGSYKGRVNVTVRDALGAVLAKDAIPPGQTKSIEFTCPSVEGAVTVDCQSGRNAVAVTAEGGRLVIPAGKRTVRVIGRANPLYFFVEKGTREFPLHVSGGGGAETVRAVVRDPRGKSVVQISTVDKTSNNAIVRVRAGMDGAVWSVHLTKAERGVFEDASLRIPSGVGPFLSEKPGDLVIPAVRLEAAAMVRSKDRRSFCARAMVAGALVKQFGDLRLSVLDSAGKTLSSRTFQPGSMRVWNPAETLPVGNYRLRLTCKSGTQAISVEQGLFVIDGPKTLTPGKTLSVGGKPFFARGLYHVNSKDYELVKAQGFNIVQAGPGQIGDCRRVGLKAAVVLYGGMGVRIDHYRRVLTKYRDNPAVACWMTMDEPSLHGVPIELMVRGYATIRELSGQPAYTCICRPDSYVDYGDGTDIIAIDVYPVGRSPLTAIADTLETAKATVPGHTIWFIGQVWSWPKTRLVTPREHRCMSYLALTHADVRGLFWYSFRDSNWYLPESNKPVWEMCGQVNRELIQLEPVLLTNNVWERVKKAGLGEVHLAGKRHDGKLYIIATNPTEQPAELDLDLRRDRTEDIATEVFEKRRIKLEAGRLRERFEPLDTRVYAVPLRK